MGVFEFSAREGEFSPGKTFLTQPCQNFPHDSPSPAVPLTAARPGLDSHQRNREEGGRMTFASITTVYLLTAWHDIFPAYVNSPWRRRSFSSFRRNFLIEGFNHGGVLFDLTHFRRPLSWSRRVSLCRAI